MWRFKRLLRFLAIPIAMTCFVLAAWQAGGFVLRKDPQDKTGGQLYLPGKDPRG
jgi:hypothetical protein